VARDEASGGPPRQSAVIVRASLPAGLERLRRASVADAGDGVPAHLTLLYPFVHPGELRLGLRRTLAGIARRHEPFDYEQVGMATWPDTIYVAVSPTEPFTRLQGALQAAFPDYPIYGREAGSRFVPHVTIAEDSAVHDEAVRSDRAWRALPRRDRATAIELIASDAGGTWRTVWRIPLGAAWRATAAQSAADRMRP
jgi:2'-5' RNA ligase